MNFIPMASSSKGNAYLLESPGAAPVLLEAGIPIKSLREKLWSHGVRLSDLAECLVSHSHGDHARGVKDILKAGVDVWTSIETATELGIESHHRFNDLSSGVKTTIGTWTVLPFDLHHDVPTQGFFIRAPDGERLLFVPDTSYIRDRFSAINILAIECNHVADILSENIQEGNIPSAVGRRVRRNHMSLDSVIGMLKANDLSRCREVWLLHLSDANSSEERMKREIQEATGIPVRICEE